MYRNSEDRLLKEVRVDINFSEDTESVSKFKKRIQQEKQQKYVLKDLHGQFERQTKVVKTLNSWGWVKRGQLKGETESLIFAAQEQATIANAIKVGIHHQVGGGKCRLCYQKTESITHVLSECRKLAQKNINKDMTRLLKGTLASLQEI